jgi:5-methylcytosine-specific restriction endonuclease McrA
MPAAAPTKASGSSAVIEINCAHCGTKKLRNTGEVNRANKAGKPVYCSQACASSVRRTGKQAKGWHERRFEDRVGTVRQPCLECGRVMWLPPSKIHEYKRCGPECNAEWRRKNHLALVRDCETCGKTFRPRPIQIANGGGVFCSQRCNTRAQSALQTQGASERRIARMQELRAEGKWTVHFGPDHHSWKGGRAAARARQISSGKAAAQLRAYRKKNPHRVREWHSRRRNGKVMPRLPWGTIPRIGNAQRWRCAICRCSIKGGYHLDHIMPIARGGKHEPRNLQLLCGPCNVRKSAKDPIDYMRQIGRLL